MRFLILGPLEVHIDNGPVALGGVKPRALLAFLLLHPNEAVSAERLAVALWGEDTPSGATKTVQVHVSRLRKALGDADVIATTQAGYRVRVGPDELDAARFERLVESGRRALAGGQAEHAAAVLREALDLWRGPALVDLEAEPFARTELARLEEQRLAALEARAEADLAAGRHAQLVGELAQLVGAHPMRELLVAHLMLALYRCGRQSDALEAYQDARRVLVAEIGVEPGPRLRELQDAILRQDDALQLGRSTAGELPPELDAATAAPIAGRADELAWLRLRWERTREGAGGLVVLTGEPGAGKTRLAAELAGDAHRRGDSVLYASGKGASGPALGVLHGLEHVTQPSVLVFDDADAADDDVRGQLEASTQAVGILPLLVLVCARDADAVQTLRADGVLTLEPLAEEAVRAIGSHYASTRAPADVPAGWLLEASGGLPRRVHDLASQWARREAARRVTVVAERTVTERAQLRTLQDELVGGVVELQEAGERVRRPTRRREGSGEPPVVCPFKGLASYDAGDAEYFFGRERLVAELVARLVGAPLLAIVGASGSGKSSVLRAGLMPALAAGMLPGSETWRQVLLRPGRRPVDELAKALADAGESDGRTLIAVDQFEEAFTVCDDDAVRAEFISELVSAAQEPDGRYVVVLALRADAYGRSAAYPELSALVSANNVLVRSMHSAELRRAVEGPCRRADLKIDPELVEQLVTDVEREPGGLPLLSAALLELWQRRDGRRLRHADYLRTGGVHGAVARLAEDAYAKLDEAQRPAARAVLMRLVGVTEDGAVERRRLALDELEADGDESAARVVALLTDRRLLTVDAGSIEIAHEALLREWPRLRDWIEEDRDGLRTQRALGAAAHEWQELGRDDGALYRGTRLREASEWDGQRQPALSRLEREFLEASEASRRHEHLTRRRRTTLVFGALGTAALAIVVVAVITVFSQRERDIAASRDIAARSATVLDSDPGLALAVARVALDRHDTAAARRAVRQATLADRTVFARRADKVTYSLAVSADGKRVATVGTSGSARIWDLERKRVERTIKGSGPNAYAVSLSRDGKRIAIGSADGSITIAGVDGRGRRQLKPLAPGDFAVCAAFSPDGSTLAVGTAGGSVRLIRVAAGGRDAELGRHDGPTYSVAFNADGSHLVSAWGEDGARIWDVANATMTTLEGGADTQAASFGRDGRVATAHLDGAVRIWNRSDARTPRHVFEVDAQELNSVRFSRDGRRLVTAGADGVVRVSDATTGALLSELGGHTAPVRYADFVPGASEVVSVGDDGALRVASPLTAARSTHRGTGPTFSADNRHVVTGDDDGGVFLWNPASGEERRLDGHTKPSLAGWSADGDQIVSASEDGTVRLYDMAADTSRKVPAGSNQKFAVAVDRAGQLIAIGGEGSDIVLATPAGKVVRRLKGHTQDVYALAFSPDGKLLVSGSADRTARIWEVATGRRLQPLRGHVQAISSAAFSPTGRSVLTVGDDATVRVWPVDGGDPVVLVGHAGRVNAASFSADGTRVASAGDDGTVRLWDAGSGEMLVVLHTTSSTAWGAGFSPDGRLVTADDSGMTVTGCEVCGDMAAVLALARTRDVRRLTDDERVRFLGDG